MVISMNKIRVLICGASGFAGNNILLRLSKSSQFEVIGTYFSKKPKDVPSHVELVRADLTDRATVFNLTKNIDILFDYAAIATNFKDVVTKPYIHTTDNVVISSLLIRSAFENGVKHFIFPSCGYLYNHSAQPFKETDVDYNNLPPKFMGAAWSKVYLEKMCEFYSTLGKTKFTVIRQANLYGPYDKSDLEVAHALPATIIKALTTKTGSIQVWGDGTQKKDQLYIDDLLDLLEIMIEQKSNAFDFLNVGTGQFVTMKQMAEYATRFADKNIQIQYDTSMPSNDLYWCLDSSKAKKQFGWTPKISLEEGMKRTTEWYQKTLAVR